MATLRNRGVLQARCRQIEASVAYVFQVPHEALRSSTRGKAGTALARQVAMYLCHTSLGFSLSDVGRLFDRDRTTVSHACKIVEDMRDGLAFDLMMICLDQSVQYGMRVPDAFAVTGKSPSKSASVLGKFCSPMREVTHHG